MVYHGKYALILSKYVIIVKNLELPFIWVVPLHSDFICSQAALDPKSKVSLLKGRNKAKNCVEIWNIYCSCNKSINREKNISYHISKIKIFLSSIRWDHADLCRRLSLDLMVVQRSKGKFYYWQSEFWPLILELMLLENK